MNKVIKIEDYPCGSGKTTKMIEGFRPENKYLAILPMLTEVTRVIEGSKDIEFVQPYANDNEQGTKTSSTLCIYVYKSLKNSAVRHFGWRCKKRIIFMQKQAFFA